MRRRMAGGFIIMLIAGLGGMASGNLLTDPGFEGLDPAWWNGNINSVDCGQWHWTDRTDAHSGTDMVALGYWGTGGTNFWGQDVAGIVAGDVVDFSVYMKTEETFQGEVYLQVEFKDAANQVIRTDVSSITSVANTNWSQMSMATAPAPVNTASMNVMIYGDGSANSAMFDDADATVQVIPEASSMLMLGVGLVGLLKLRRRVV